MNELTIRDMGTLLRAGGSHIPAPYERKIPLLETCLAGTTEVVASGYAGAAIRLGFEKESGRVAVSAGGEKIGYLPRQDSGVIEKLLLAGKGLSGEIIETQKIGSWRRVRVCVELEDI